eukprot:CAMPEP_0117422764 /NCGR_PEP_ID=MMETSP0758-20121206/3546_1 /TAXON_ID=63605 /ORGANISM="Percolomonas cosmopolitus, Strain AE-1 (ATCC 50343)" /LENGTH=640 /DNA_ID=CAMNT_0005205595 /DNA_START=206 /DNA_END=2128 /DNA_ORIENTATION=-
MNSEDPEEMVQELRTLFIKILDMKYLKKMDMDSFSLALMRGDRSLIIGILYFILERFEALKTRVYLSRYLFPIKVPDDVFAIDSVRTVYTSYESLIKRFKETHQRVNQLRKTTSSPQEIKRSVYKLSQEKETLIRRTQEQRRKVHSIHSDPEKFIEVATALRKQQMDRKKLTQSTETQLAALKTAQQTLEHMEEKSKETNQRIGEMDVTALVNKLGTDVRGKKELVESKLPQQKDSLKVQIENMEDLKTKPVNIALQDLERSIEDVQQQITAEEAKLTSLQAKSKNSNQSSKLARRQATILRNKRREAESQLRSLRSEHERLKNRIGEVKEQVESHSNDKIPTQEEYEEYKKQILRKATKTQSMQAELSMIRGEVTVLQRTQQILGVQSQDAKEFLEKLAARQGVTGFQDVQAQIEEASRNKQKVDQEKGQTLQEISELVATIQQKIASKRNELAPTVLKMKEVRRKYQDIQQEYSEKEAIYENAKVSLEASRQSNQSDIDVIRSEVERSESLYHLLNAQLELADIAKQQVVEEQEYARSKTKNLNAQYKSYEDMYTQRLSSLEEASKELREEQRFVKENHEPNLEQISGFQNLKKLLEMKLHILRNPTNDYANTRNQEHDIIHQSSTRDEQLLILAEDQ